MSQKRKHSPDPPQAEDDIFRSEPIEDRSSTFVGCFSPSASAKQLQNLTDLKNASHKMVAWRKPGNQRLLVAGATQFNIGSDDDGEKFGGKKIEKVLESLNVVGTCVVARWYGGVMLGPVRFTHIEQCAKEAVRKWQTHEAEQRIKRQKAASDEVDRERLIRALAERDESIVILRALAAEKEEAVKRRIIAGTKELESSLKDHTDPSGDPTPPPPATATPVKPALDYVSMPVDKLRTLERARDATLGFLLKRIDKAEADLTALDHTSPAAHD